MPTPQDNSLQQDSPEPIVVEPQLQLAILSSTSPNEPAAPLFSITDGVLTIPEELTKLQWFNGLRVLKSTYDNYKLFLAGYMSYGEAKWGKDAVENALHQLEFDMPTVRQAIDINTVPLDIRRPGLTGEHYVVLARSDLKPKQLAKWAKTASDQNLSAQQLKASIDAGEVVTTAVVKQRQHGVVTIDGIRQEFEIWLRRMGGSEGILKLPEDTVREIIKDLRPIAALCSKLEENKPTSKKKAPRKTAKAKKPKKPKKAQKTKTKTRRGMIKS